MQDVTFIHSSIQPSILRWVWFLNPVYTITGHGTANILGRVPLFIGTANSDSVNGTGSTPVPRFLAVTSTTKYVGLGTLAVPWQLLRRCKRSAVPWKTSVCTVKMTHVQHTCSVRYQFLNGHGKKISENVPCRDVPKQIGAVPSASRAQNVIV